MKNPRLTEEELKANKMRKKRETNIDRKYYTCVINKKSTGALKDMIPVLIKVITMRNEFSKKYSFEKFAAMREKVTQENLEFIDAMYTKLATRRKGNVIDLESAKTLMGIITVPINS